MANVELGKFKSLFLFTVIASVLWYLSFFVMGYLVANVYPQFLNLETGGKLIVGLITNFIQLMSTLYFSAIIAKKWRLA